METALQRGADDRKTILHKSSQELITPFVPLFLPLQVLLGTYRRLTYLSREISYQLAALYVMECPDPKSEVFGVWYINHGPTSLRFFEMNLTRQWNNKKEQVRFISEDNPKS
jgi:hypothetical protein